MGGADLNKLSGYPRAKATLAKRTGGLCYLPPVTARADLRHIAYQAMVDRGLLPQLSDAAVAEAERLAEAAHEPAPPDRDARDLRGLLWASIDNDDSLDLDQLSVAQALSSGGARIFVAIADVDSKVPLGSALDDHARI